LSDLILNKCEWVFRHLPQAICHHPTPFDPTKWNGANCGKLPGVNGRELFYLNICWENLLLFYQWMSEWEWEK
jgi:hypothetical protein